MSGPTRAPAADAIQDALGGADEAAGVLVGLDEFEVLAARQRGDGVLEVEVRCRRAEAACPRCGMFSSRLKQRRVQRVRDLHCFARAVVLLQQAAVPL